MNFKQTQISLAVGASLLALAGAAQAALPTGTPVARTAKPMLVTPASLANANSLYDQTAGFTGTLAAKFYIDVTALDSVTTTNYVVLSAGADGLKVNNANDAAANTGACVATDDLCVYAGTAGASQVNLQVAIASVSLTANAGGHSSTPANGVATANFTITTSVNEALRIVPATGVLEYTADKNATPVVWQTVSVAIQAPAASPTNFNGFCATDSTAGSACSTNAATQMALVAGQSVFNTVAPAVIVKTRATAGLVDGVILDTVTPTDAAPAVGATKSIIVMTNPSACAAATSATDFADVAVAPNTVATVVSAGGTANAVLFATPTTVDWSATAGTAADAAVYTSSCFNTGVNKALAVADGTGSTMPFSVKAIPSGANSTIYTFVFDAATGAKAKLTTASLDTSVANINAVADNVTPTLTGAAENGGNLVLTFSEPIVEISDDNGNAALLDTGDLREMAENVLLGSDSIAALNLNAGGGLTGTISSSSNRGVLTIAGIAAADLTKQVTVLKGITVQEQDENALFATTDVIEADAGGAGTSGGLTTAAGETLSAAATTIVPTPPTLTFDKAAGETTIKAAAVDAGGANAGKIAKVTLTFSKPVKLGASKTMAQLAQNLMIEINGISATTGQPATFNFYPTSADLTNMATGGSTMDINLPTALIYSRLDYLANDKGVKVYWFGTNGGDYPADVLTNVNAADVGLTVASNDYEAASLPFSLTGDVDTNKADSTLQVQTVQGTVGASGDAVYAYLAKWYDAPATDSTNWTTTVSNIKFGDRFGMIVDDAGDSDSTGGLADLKLLVEAALNAVKVAKPAQAGVSNAVVAAPAANVPGYLVGNKLIVSSKVSGGVNVSDTEDAYREALDVANNLSSNIRNAASSAATAGAQATGATGTNNAGAINSSMNAGVTAALGSIASDASGFGLPDDVVKAARTAAEKSGATVSSVIAAVLGADLGQGWVQAAQVNPNNGDVLVGGKVTAKVTLSSKATVLNGGRGLDILNSGDPVGAVLVQASGKLNLIAGIDLPNTNIDAAKAEKAFLLLVHHDANTGKYSLITSANPLAKNFVPFVPDWFNTTGKATQVGTISLAATDMKQITPNSSNSNWQLIGLGAPNENTAAPAGHVPSLPRSFVGLDTATGDIFDMWSLDRDTEDHDMALALAGNKTAVATELADGSTLSTIVAASYVKSGNALAWHNDDNDSDKTLFVMQAAIPTSGVVLPVGWSLVNMPSGTISATSVQAVLNIGAQAGTGQTTWFADDGGTPSVTAGKAYFVFSKSGGKITQ